MFINATQLTQNRVPSDASSVAFQVAIEQQREFEEALKRSQDRREAEAAADRAQAEAQKEAALAKAIINNEANSANLDLGSDENTPETGQNSESRGASVDLEV